MPALPGTYGGDYYGGGYYGGGIPPVPTLHVHIAFDVDPLVLGGIITGDSSTCESLGGWVAPRAASSAAPLVVAGRDRRRPRSRARAHLRRSGRPSNTVTLNGAASRCYAGSHCIQVTAQAPGNASAHLYGQAGITAGRTYLLWVHIRPEAAARTGRVTLTWRSATGVLVGTSTVDRTEVADRYVQIGLLATAPPAATQVDVSVTWLDCAAGEVHYLDTVTLDYVGADVSEDVLPWSVTLSGRNHELDRTDAGSASVTLDNRFGYYTPGRTTGVPAPYLGNIRPRKRIWFLAEWAGVLYPLWSGYTRAPRAVYPGGRPDASVATFQCDDAFRVLTGTDIPPPYRAEVLSDAPLSLFCLDEPSTATTAGSLVEAYPAQLLSAQAGDGDSAFGATTVLPVTITGSNTDGGSTSLGLNLETPSLDDRGSVLDLRYAGGMPPQLSVADWTMEFWFLKSGGAPGIAQLLFRHLVSGGGTDLLSGFQVTIETSGFLKVVTGGSETVAETTSSVANGAPHHIVLVYEGDGSTYGLATLYVDGAEVGSLQLTADPLVAGMPNNAQLGGALATINNTISFPYTGRVSHVAFYYRRLAAARIQAHFLVGFTGLYLETDGDRLRDVLALGGWPAEDTRIDAGLTQLIPREWSETNVLALGQDTTAHGGGSLVMDAAGRVRQLNRHRFVNQVLVAATFRASTGTEPEHVDYEPHTDDTRIENVVKVARIGGGTIQVQSGDETTGSIATYGRIKGETIPLGAATDIESVSHARWRLSRTDEDRVRIASASWLPVASATGALWPLLLPREFGDRIHVAEQPAEVPGTAEPARAAPPPPLVVVGADRRRPSTRGRVHLDRTAWVQPASSTLDVIVGRIRHWGDNGAEWRTAIQLEPAVIDAMGVCDHPVYGIADTAACVAGY